MDSLSAAIVNTSVALAQTQAAQQVAIAVLKKAMDIDASAAAALVQALPPPPPAGAIGGLIDVWA